MRRWTWLLLGLVACHTSGSASAPPDGGQLRPPVQVAQVRIASLPQTETGPGQTQAIEQQKLKAPFNGTLVEFSAADGDRVTAGQVLGAVVAEHTEAALRGAQAMLKAARTASERRNAQRAVQLAERSVVRMLLRAPEAGVVLSHSAGEGDLVTQGEELARIAATDSLVFVAELNQSAVSHVLAGQQASVELSVMRRKISGVVGVVLPSASATSATVPVQIRFDAGQPPVTTVGLFGTAVICVGTVRGAQVVPGAAVLRDDVSGASRIATVDAQGRVHWVQVKTGLSSGRDIQVLSPSLAAGQRVIVSGQVGLPERSQVQVKP